MSGKGAHSQRYQEGGTEMRFLRLILGIIFSLAGIVQFANTPLLGLGIALLGGAMVLDASFEQKISGKK